MMVAPITPEEADVPIAVRICPTKMSREDYTKVMADPRADAAARPRAACSTPGYGEDEVHMFDVWDSRESFEPYHQDLVGHLQAAGLDGGMVVHVEPVHSPHPD